MNLENKFRVLASSSAFADNALNFLHGVSAGQNKIDPRTAVAGLACFWFCKPGVITQQQQFFLDNLALVNKEGAESVKKLIFTRGGQLQKKICGLSLMTTSEGCLILNNNYMPSVLRLKLYADLDAVLGKSIDLADQKKMSPVSVNIAKVCEIAAGYGLEYAIDYVPHITCFACNYITWESWPYIFGIPQEYTAGVPDDILVNIHTSMAANGNASAGRWSKKESRAARLKCMLAVAGVPGYEKIVIDCIKIIP